LIGKDKIKLIKSKRKINYKMGNFARVWKCARAQKGSVEVKLVVAYRSLGYLGLLRDFL